MDDANMRMHKTGSGFGLSAEPFALIGILGQLFAHDLDGHQTLQVRILPQEHFTHPAGAQAAHQPVSRNSLVWHQNIIGPNSFDSSNYLTYWRVDRHCLRKSQ